MPSFKTPAFYLSHDGRQVLSGDFAITMPVSELKYSLGSSDFELLPEIEIRGDITPSRMSFDGRSLLDMAYDGISTQFGTLSWGAFRETRMLVLELGDPDRGGEAGAVLMPLQGDVLPDLGQGGAPLLAEFLSILNYEIDGTIRNDPMAAGRMIPVERFFTDETSGPLKQGNEGDNRISGSAKEDLLVGQGGNDQLRGKGGDDTLMAGKGDDRVWGGGGHDVLTGFDGDDRLWGQKGMDLLMGGNGADMLRGGRGHDFLEGGAGADDFHFSRGDGFDMVFDFGWGRDKLVLDDALWRGDLSARQVVQRFADLEEDGVMLDFGRKGAILLDGFHDIDALARMIEIA